MSPTVLVSAIVRNGFVVAERRLEPSALEQVRCMHAQYIATVDSRNVRISSSRSDTRVHLDPDLPGFRRLHADSLLCTVAAQVMKAPTGLHYLLSRTVHPGASAQALHMDCDPGTPPSLGFIYTLDDFTADNGCTQFVAGSHRAAPAASTTLAAAPAGSLILYDRSILHGYTANTSNADRRSVQGGFSVR